MYWINTYHVKEMSMHDKFHVKPLNLNEGFVITTDWTEYALFNIHHTILIISPCVMKNMLKSFHQNTELKSNISGGVRSLRQHQNTSCYTSTEKWK